MERKEKRERVGEGRKEGKGERELQRQREYKQGKQRWPQTTLELWLALYMVMLSWAYMYLMFLPIYSPKFGVKSDAWRVKVKMYLGNAVFFTETLIIKINV